MDQQYVTPTQLAHSLKLTRQCVLYHIRLGHIAAERPARDYLITVAEAERVKGIYRRHAQRVWQQRPAGQEARSA